MVGTRRSEAVRPGRLAPTMLAVSAKATLPVVPQVSMRRIFMQAISGVSKPCA